MILEKPYFERSPSIQEQHLCNFSSQSFIICSTEPIQKLCRKEEIDNQDVDEIDIKL